MANSSEPSITQFGGIGRIEAIAAGIRLALILIWIVVLLPLFVVCCLTTPTLNWFLKFFWKGVLRFANIKVVVRGEQSTQRPLLIVCNHVSYLDIAILGSVLNGRFVSKSDVAGWPGIGPLASVAGTIFIERKRSEAAKQKVELGKRLASGMPLILFPEGTSNDGNRVLPFKSTLFSVAEKEIDGKPVTVQPVSIAYTRCRGVPIGYAWRHFYAWYGDMELAPHLWALLHLGQLTVEVNVMSALSLSELGSRKNAAHVCEALVRRSVSGSLSGREDIIPSTVKQDNTPPCRVA